MTPDTLPLPRGITGFSSNGNIPFRVKFADFKRACYGASLATGARNITFHNAEGQVEPNFHWAEVQTSSETVYVLCNAHLPWVAFVEADPQGVALQFSEKAELMEAWNAFPEFRVLDVTYLEAIPALDVLQYLDPAERHQIKFWKPQRIGDIIFNHWD